MTALIEAAARAAIAIRIGTSGEEDPLPPEVVGVDPIPLLPTGFVGTCWAPLEPLRA
ncbi:MAG: hypothetical protein WB507_10065 [Solirubrobacterales bacterium]